MADFQEQLNSILSDPEAMAQIASLAQSLGGGENQSEEPHADAEGPDPELMGRLMPILSRLNRPENTETAAFLRALRPFLSEKRRDKVERAARLAQVIHLAKTFLISGEGEDHV